MNRLHRFPSIAFIAILLIASSSMLFVSCRPSRQESRRPSPTPSAQVANQTNLGHEVDSLVIIEEKLLEVIDSMTGLVNSDHSRIRELEREVHEMSTARNAFVAHDTPQASGIPRPPTDSPYSSSQSSWSNEPPATPPPVTPEPVTAPAASSTMQEPYGTALGTFNDNNFETALTQFQSLEKDDPNGVYASNYKYWEGECYYAEKRYNMALQTFGTTLSQFPNSAKAAAAQFKIGECYEKLNIPSSARQAYERVIADYPSSEYKARAQSRLNALSN